MKRWEAPGDVRFVTFSCEKRLPLFGSARIRDVFADRLGATRDLFRCELFAWVVMPEHVHLIVRPKDGELEPVLDYLKKSVSRKIISRWRELNAPILKKIELPNGSPRFWQKGGGFDRNIRHEGEFVREVRYIHRNPVERELVEQPRDWEWSSARWWLGEESGGVVCDQPQWIDESCNDRYV
ncbi:MAG: transposase [Phycisphaerae bacterium]|nr:transposase [Phycisphaerae bacterium]